MKTVEIRSLENQSDRCAVYVDGLVHYVGSAEQCRQRAQLLLPPPGDRARQDKMLYRATGA